MRSYGIIRNTPTPKTYLFIVTFFILGICPHVYADEQDFNTGMEYLENGDPASATKVFGEIWNKDNENSEAGYNLGLGLLSMGMPDSAAHIFEQVASLENTGTELRRDALYNLGLAKAYMAQQASAMNPTAARQIYMQSVDNFRDALAHTDHDPDFRKDAGYNIEAIWRRVHQLEEQMQQGGQAADSLAREVQDLAEKQSDLNNRSGDEKDAEEHSEEQKNLGEKASDLADELSKRGMDEPASHMKEAEEAQQNAAEELKNRNFDQARGSQDDAMDKLREALASLLQEQEQPGQKAEEQSSDAQDAAEELARLRRESEQQKKEREEELKRRGLYKPSQTEQVPVEKDW